MNKTLLVLLFISGAALTWGTYVPSIHVAAGDPKVGLHSNLRAFLFVGVAYFLTAVLIPLALIWANADPTARPTANWNAAGIRWGIIAGCLGAAGALCVIFAVTASKGGMGPLYVAPLVFAGAPIVNTIATLVYFHPVKTLPDWKFFAGLVLAAVGAVMVMLFKPVDKPDAPATAAQVEEASAVGETAALP
ncbi:hypothetical protein [Alienimonas sp. DA493]|uniref:hypothetical protein n=1 Tax=Alienimonas sp. DA493 TaxID=3373605 RepID=UPI00375401F3